MRGIRQLQTLCACLLLSPSINSKPLSEQLPLEFSFQHQNNSYDQKLFLEFDKKSSFESKNGIRFEVTPRKLYSNTFGENDTVLLEMKITDEKQRRAKKIIARPYVSLERGGSATINEDSKGSNKPYQLSVTSLR